MKLSTKIQKCELSPIRKYAPYAAAARARGIKIYPLNIGQPDIETPAAFFEAVRAFKSSVLEYAPSDGVPEYLKAVHDYYLRIGLDLAPEDILATAGGSEADNWVKEVMRTQKAKGKNHFITTAVEHHAMLHSAQRLQKEG